MLEVGTAKIWRESDATRAPLHFYFLIFNHTLNLNPSPYSLGPYFCSRSIGSLNFGASLVLDPMLTTIAQIFHYNRFE